MRGRGPSRTLRWPLAAGVLLFSVVPGALTACVAQRGHPVRTSLPRLTAPEVRALGMYTLAEPVDPAGADAAAFLFYGLEGLSPDLQRLRAMAAPHGRVPQLTVLSRLEKAVKKRYARGGFGGPVRLVGALGVVGTVPLAPTAMADLMMDPAAEKQVLAADVFQHLGTEYSVPGARRERYRIEIMRIGQALWIYDMRFSLVAERRDLAGGSVLLRYDPCIEPPPEHVTLWRGACYLEPHGTGTRVTEILIIGTDVNLPFFLEGALRKLVRKKLSDRAQNLWVRAWAGR